MKHKRDQHPQRLQRESPANVSMGQLTTSRCLCQGSFRRSEDEGKARVRSKRGCLAETVLNKSLRMNEREVMR